MPDLTSTYLEQVDAVIEKYNDLRNIPRVERSGLDYERIITLCRALVHRVTGSNSPYAAQLSTIPPRDTYEILVPKIVGIATALQDDLKAGYLKTSEELIHGEIFGDLLEMGDHLLEQEYKDAAAVVIGSTLEAHLRQLCQKFGVETESTDKKGNLFPKKADRMNSELVASSAYGKLDHKSVTAWLGLRNNAAHGKYDEYTLDQVKLLNQGVRDFVSRNPA